MLTRESTLFVMYNPYVAVQLVGAVSVNVIVVQILAYGGQSVQRTCVVDRGDH